MNWREFGRGFLSVFWRQDKPATDAPKLRCRPGDLCWVVRDSRDTCAYGSYVALRGGTVVQVVEHDGHFWLFKEPVPYRHVFADAGRVVSGTVTAAVDELLMPLRPDDGADEMLRIAGLPRHVDSPQTEPAQ